MGKITTCKKCGKEIAIDAKTCPNCGAKNKRIKAWQIITIIFVLFIIWAGMSSNNSSSSVNTTDSKTEKHGKEINNQAMKISVESLIVKKVANKYRYFFAIRNKDENPFEGKVDIQLVNAQGQAIARDSFSTKSPMIPGGGASVYIDASTGTVSTHGDFGYNKYKYQIYIDDSKITENEGNISDKYEEL